MVFEKRRNITVLNSLSSSSTSPVQSGVIYDAISKKPNTFVGTTAEWNALTSGEKAQYEIVNITDDGSVISDIQTALNMLFPNTWTANTEISFGNGLYGYRAVGTITASAGTRATTGIVSGATGDLVNYGGYWTCNNGNWKIGIGINPYGSGQANFNQASVLYKSSSVIYMHTLDNNARTDAPYDIWVTYTK